MIEYVTAPVAQVVDSVHSWTDLSWPVTGSAASAHLTELGWTLLPDQPGRFQTTLPVALPDGELTLVGVLLGSICFHLASGVAPGRESAVVPLARAAFTSYAQAFTHLHGPPRTRRESGETSAHWTHSNGAGIVLTRGGAGALRTCIHAPVQPPLDPGYESRGRNARARPRRLFGSPRPRA